MSSFSRSRPPWAPADPGPGEVPRTLVEPTPQTLDVLDQVGLWGNLGGTLLGYTLAQVGCYALGLVALLTVTSDADHMFTAFLAVPFGTVLAGAVNLYGYASFLSLIGAVFVPMFAVLVVDYFGFDGGSRWNLSASAAPRRLMFLPWAAGFAVYQLINPGQVGWWTTAWRHAATAIHLIAQPWMSASLFSFAAAGLLTAGLDALPGAST